MKKYAIFLIILCVSLSYASESKSDSLQKAASTEDSGKKIELITKKIEKLEKQKGKLNAITQIQKQFDLIRVELLSIKNDDPQYKMVPSLIDRYIELQSSQKKELTAIENSPAEKARRELEEAKNELEEAKEAKKHGVSIGMSKEDVLRSNWRKPQYKNITATAYGTSEQWVYRNDNYLYFDGDILTSIQTHR